MNAKNNISARMAFDNAKTMFFNSFRDKFSSDADCRKFVDSLKLSQSEIRLEVQLTTANSSFVFGLTPNQANTSNVIFNTENRLQLQDSLCVSEYGIYVANPASSSSTIFPLNNWGNPNVFTTANVATAVDGTFFTNGAFKLTCNNDVLIPYRGLFNHRVVPQTQQTSVVGSATIAAPKDEQIGAEDGVVTCEPNLVLIGSKNYQPQIVLPSALAAVETNMRAVVIFRGILAQNSTVIN